MKIRATYNTNKDLFMAFESTASRLEGRKPRVLRMKIYAAIETIKDYRSCKKITKGIKKWKSGFMEDAIKMCDNVVSIDSIHE